MADSKALTACIFSLVLLLCYLGNKSLKYYRYYKLSNCVAWCATTNSAIHRCNMSLSKYIRNAQNRVRIASEYAISGDSEWTYVNTILAGFSDNLVQSFFSGSLSYKNTAELKHLTCRNGSVGEHFFMFQLFCYLSDHKSDSSFLGYEMNTNIISPSHEISDFATVVNKLQYVTYLYCKESEIYKNDIAEWLTDKHFTDVIDKTISVTSRK